MNTSKGKKILVVEDDQSLSILLTEKLINLGFEVANATTGQQAFNSVKNSKPELVVLDIMLPGGANGFDFLEQIKSNEEYKGIKVLVLTNLDTEEKTAMDIGAEDYMVKANNSLDEVVARVQDLLK